MKKTLIVAEAAVDLAAFVEKLPRSNEDEIHPSRTVTRIGGSGWCATNVFQGLGYGYTLLCDTGSGIYAEEVRRQAQELGIPLMNASGETAGCTYTLIDREGNHGLLAAPGCEYHFSLNMLDDLKLDDYRALYLSGSMFDGDGVQDLLDLLHLFKGEIFFQTGGRGVIQDHRILNAIYEVHPVMCMSEEELSVLTDEEKDLMLACEKVETKTQRPVVILMNDGSGFYKSGREGISASTRMAEVKDASGCEEGFGASFLAAKISGLKPRAALNYAVGYASYIARNETMICDAGQKADLREALKASILGNK